jgi:hypothetical protein
MIKSILCVMILLAVAPVARAQYNLINPDPPCSLGGYFPPGTFNIICRAGGTCTGGPFVRITASASAYGINCQQPFFLEATGTAYPLGAQVRADSEGRYVGGIGFYAHERFCSGDIFYSGGWEGIQC